MTMESLLFCSKYVPCYSFWMLFLLLKELFKIYFYDKRDDFNFVIVNFPFLSNNIPSTSAYGVYVSHLVRCARTCCKYQDFVDRRKLLTNKLLSQGYCKAKLVSS